MSNGFFDLQNGSDIRGVAMDGVEGESVNLTESEAVATGSAFSHWLSMKVGKNAFDLQVCVGHDPRLSAEPLVRGLMKGMCCFGTRVSDAGLASSPAMFMSTVMPYYEFDGAIMVTASHLPFNRNGFKFFTAEGGLDKEDIAEILRLASKVYTRAEYYEKEDVTLMDMYAAHLRSIITGELKGDLKGMKIAVDAGNGAGGFFAEKVLAPLGADISGSQFLEPDGHFPNHIPNPENPEAMDSICRRVRETGSDLGIIFDTDVDRSAAVTSSGAPLGRNEIVALAAALGAEKHPGGTVVTDSITSNGLHDFLTQDLGLKHLRYRRGYRNVINKAVELADKGEDAFLAIETSGHAAYSDNYYLDDGAYLAAMIVAAAAKLKRDGNGVESLIEGLSVPAEAKEFRLSVSTDDFSSVAAAVLDGMREWASSAAGLSLAEPNHEGVRVNYDIDGATGWFLLRKSLHDPLLPLNIESDSVGGVRIAADIIADFLSRFDSVDTSLLK